MRLRIHYRTFNSGGKGGQHSNRTENAVEASVRLPDGRRVTATSQTSKSQHRNKRIAAAVLRARVIAALAPEEERRRTEGFGASERVRNYHQPDDRVTCEASGQQRSYRQVLSKPAVFGELIEVRRQALLDHQQQA